MYRQGSKTITLLYKHNVNMINKIERCFYKTRSHMSDNMKNSFQQGTFINKIMDRDGRKKPWYPVRTPRNESMDVIKERLVNPHVTRRVIVLNKLFMKHITDLMAVGEIATQTLGRGIEISRVNFTNDFKVVRVYWFSSYTDILDETTAILEKISYKLRHQLTQLKVIGVMPLIQFVLDTQLMKYVELEKRFLEADYGDDYVPKIKVAPKRQLTLFTQLPKEVQERIRKMNSTEEISNNNELEDDDEIYDVDLPPMKHDTLGFDHSVIMSTIKQSLNKARGKSLNQSEDTHLYTPEVIDIEFNKKYSNILPSKEEDDAFLNFLEKRKIEEKRKRQRRNESLENIDEYEECISEEISNDNGIDYDDFDDIKTHELS
ncbi:uncharacterized protein [Chelonus insularis]|uniref:uncharacterized protein n=1 Tax=Chelonus insularis TaxID=460826 RepID=UPI00158ACFA2|nr:uncharacterized protein LOC118072943 [Chelonus insularis]